MKGHDGLPMKKSSTVTLGITASMALVLSACSGVEPSYHTDGLNVYENIDSNYVQLCKNTEDNTRTDWENCKNSNSPRTQWYFMPIYNDDITIIPGLGEKIEGAGLDSKPDDPALFYKMNTSIEKKEKESNSMTGLVASAPDYGISSQGTDAEFVELCVDKDGNRVDDHSCQTTHNHREGAGNGFFFWYLPINTGRTSYIPGVGQHVNDDNVIKDRKQIDNNRKIEKPSNKSSYAARPNSVVSGGFGSGSSSKKGDELLKSLNKDNNFTSRNKELSSNVRNMQNSRQKSNNSNNSGKSKNSGGTDRGGFGGSGKSGG